MKCFIAVLILSMGVSSGKAQANNQGILLFTQSADAVRPHGHIDYCCETIGGQAKWLINNSHYYNANDDPNNHMVAGYDNYHNGSGDTLRYYLFLAIQALSDNNNTMITCFLDATRNDVFSGIREDKIFIIAGPSSPPVPRVSHSEEGLFLTVSWDEPFTHTGFGINYYTLQIINDTVSNKPLNMSLDRVYTSVVTELPTMCYELEYIVTACNDIGNSSGAVRGGFPIAVAPVDVQWRVLYQLNGYPHLEIWFKASNSCSYQAVSYRVQLEDTTGVSVPLNSSDHLYSVHTGLTSGASYTVVVEASSIAGTTVTRQKIVINEQLFHGDYEQQTAVLSATSGGLAGLFVIFFILSILFAYLLCRQKKLLVKRQTTRMRNEIVASPGVVTQRPTSLQTKLASTNPIYEGPLYESPNGEPLRALLGSTPSTPSASLDSPRYVFDVLPPSPPPPRKSSTASNTSFYEALDAPATSGEARKMESASEAPVVNTVGDAYTVMRPASVRPLRVSRPSPLVIPSLSTLSEV